MAELFSLLILALVTAALLFPFLEFHRSLLDDKTRVDDYSTDVTYRSSNCYKFRNRKPIYSKYKITMRKKRVQIYTSYLVPWEYL